MAPLCPNGGLELLTAWPGLCEGPSAGVVVGWQPSRAAPGQQVMRPARTVQSEDLGRFWLAQHSKKCPEKRHMAKAGPWLDGGVLGSHIILLNMLFLRIIVHSGASLNVSVLKTPNVSL